MDLMHCMANEYCRCWMQQFGADQCKISQPLHLQEIRRMDRDLPHSNLQRIAVS